MSDITMCSGIGCDMADNCYRKQALANPLRQSYFLNPPFKDGKCIEFIKMDIEEKIEKREIR